MKKSAKLAKGLVSLVLALVSLIGWAVLQGQAAPPVPESRSPFTPSSLPNLSLSQPNSATPARVAESYGKLPLSFEANRGQVNEQVKFLCRGQGFTLFLTPTEAALLMETRTWRSGAGDAKSQGSSIKQASRQVLRLKLVGANPNPQVVGLEELSGKSNYFLSKDPKKWHANIPTYAKVKYQEVYPGIDLIYYGNQQQLEHDFVIAPGADPRVIRFAFEGAENLKIDPEGNLILQIADGVIRLHKPQVYQEVNGIRQILPGSYVRLEPETGDNEQWVTDDEQRTEIGFQVAIYDASRPLVIDPVLSYSTYLGGNNHDEGRAIAVDTEGNTYVVGITFSPNFPTTVGALDTSCGIDGTCNSSVPDVFVVSAKDTGSAVFVTKLNAAGSALIYSTYLGGSRSESGSDIVVDASGNVYLVGTTFSPDFPTTPGAFDTTCGTDGTCNSSTLDDVFVTIPDVFVAKLNATGSALIYSTYLGGSNRDVGNGIAVDASGNTYVVGDTSSVDFPTTVGAFDSSCGTNGLCDNDTASISKDFFVAKLNSKGSALVYSTYLGGSNGSGSPSISVESGKSVAVDAGGNAYVTGTTDASDFPTTIGAFDTACGTDGSCNNDTFRSSPDAFVTKLNATGSALVYSTYLGGSGDDFGNSIAVDASGNAYVTGKTSSKDFPTVNPLQSIKGGDICDGPPCSDAFIVKLSPTGSTLIYSTYLGGGPNSGGLGGFDQGFDIAVDASGNAYIVGDTDSADFPITAGAFDTNCGTDGLCNADTGSVSKDAFVTKLDPEGSALIYSTYLGGSSDDSGFSIAVDISGNAYVTGITYSLNFPTLLPLQPTSGISDLCFGSPCPNAFITKIVEAP